MNKISFWLVIGVGGLPVLLAAVMYFSELGIPSGRTHSGELLSGKHINSWQLQDQQRGRWQLLLTSGQQCQDDCDSWWHSLGKVHESLGKERKRVLLLRVAQEDTQLEKERFQQLGSAVWIVDPNGNLVMRYSLDKQPKLILKDLKKLLKVSRIG
ncbi:hypothetical protein [Neptuniibacter caesariensis]|uniref:Thioredoxin domain-containing protein n=1 Tax=Neptuniibacter caesariensis TaxID=207954 RepID=A0A7U8C531_NEPCE|nr:hypothetical protein [Neptuniibacter caesariensis]EAR61364.1 hypothetical protein MED92_17698 [Oceanospirillum sp. MED92] [Neptuniibacter caesariensis]